MLSQIRALLALITAIVVTAIAAILTGIGGGGTGPAPTTTTSSSSTSSSTSTSASSTTSTTPGSTTSTTPGSTTTIPAPGTFEGADFTRLRFVITNELDWFSFILEDTPIRASRVVSTTGTLRFTSTGPTLSVTGTGVGIVDLVVEVGDEGSYELETCASQVGATTVDLRRMTDGDVSIATLVNAGTSLTPDAGGCYNAARVDVDREDLLGPTVWPTLADPRRLVLAMYFPWFSAEDWAKDFGDSPAPGVPLDTTSPAMVADAVDLAVDAGIDGFLVAWAGMAPFFGEEARIDAVYDAAGESDFEVALIIDFDVMWARDFLIGDTDLDLAFAAVASRASQPAQLEIDGQPVVFVYGSNRVDPARWEQAKNRLVATTGLQPFFVDQLDRLSAQGNYTYGSQTHVDRAALFNWSNETLYQRRLRPALLGEPLRLWVHPVQPGYDDSRLGRPNPTVAPRLDGQRYTDAWESALVARPDWIFLSTFNDYYEQTHILPGDESGTTALDATPHWTNVFHAQP